MRVNQGEDAKKEYWVGSVEDDSISPAEEGFMFGYLED
jgi:hypothetical protein